MALNGESTDLSFLPDNYGYKLVRYENKEGTNFTALFRIKDIKTREQYVEWLREYQEKSKSTWRVARTMKPKGKINMHRFDYRCQHRTDARYRNKEGKISKNTNCPAAMKITIQRYFDDPKFKKNPDEETKEYPCIVELYSWHNHLLDSALALRFRDMSTSTRDKLLQYYQAGYTASSALHALKTDLMLENAEEYSTLSADNSIIPTVSIVQHFFNKAFSKSNGVKHYPKKSENLLTNCSNSTQLAENHSENFLMPLKFNPNQTQTIDGTAEADTTLMNSTVDATATMDAISTSGSDVWNDDAVSLDNDVEIQVTNERKDKTKRDIIAWARNLCKKIDENAPFLPAAEKFLSSHKKNCNKDTGFLFSLHSYGIPSCYRRNLSGKRHRRRKCIIVRATAVGKSSTAVKGKPVVGRKAKRKKMEAAFDENHYTFDMSPN